eukprot:3906917-Pyramimonas_sp.AAC.1
MIPASDGEQVLRNRCGAFMGDTPAAVFFARTFRRPVQMWLGSMRQHSWGQLSPPPRPTTYDEWI